MKSIVAMSASAVLGLASGSVPASAEDMYPSMRVPFADLDLTRPNGRAALEARVRDAVKQMCPPRPLPNELIKLSVYRDCQTQAWASANRQLPKVAGFNKLAPLRRRNHWVAK